MEQLALPTGEDRGRNGARDPTDQVPLAEPLLDAVEAAALLKVPRRTLYELVRSRGLPHVRVGRRGLRFTRADLARWVAANTYGSTRMSSTR